MHNQSSPPVAPHTYINTHAPTHPPTASAVSDTIEGRHQGPRTAAAVTVAAVADDREASLSPPPLMLLLPRPAVRGACGVLGMAHKGRDTAGNQARADRFHSFHKPFLLPSPPSAGPPSPPPAVLRAAAPPMLLLLLAWSCGGCPRVCGVMEQMHWMLSGSIETGGSDLLACGRRPLAIFGSSKPIDL